MKTNNKTIIKGKSKLFTKENNQTNSCVYFY